MPVDMQTALVFGLFLIGVVITYKFIKMLFGALIAGVAGFLFPWILDSAKAYVPLPVSITPSLEMSLVFAGIAIALFLAFKFFRLITSFLKLVFAPFRTFGRKK